MYSTLVILHILAAMSWVGGIIFLSLVLAPLVRGRKAVAGIHGDVSICRATVSPYRLGRDGDPLDHRANVYSHTVVSVSWHRLRGRES